jgi:hypothetical protein
MRLRQVLPMCSNSKFFILSLLLLGLCVPCIFGCRERTNQGVAGHPDCLIVTPKANDVKFTKHKGTDQVTYRVREEFPAKNLLAFVSHQLQENRWEPLPYSI